MDDEPKQIPVWQRPEYSHLFYGIVAFLLAEGAPLVEFFYRILSDETPTYDLRTFIKGLGMAAAVSLAAWLKNHNKQTVTIAEQPSHITTHAITEGSAPNIPAGTTVVIPK